MHSETNQSLMFFMEELFAFSPPHPNEDECGDAGVSFALLSDAAMLYPILRDEPAPPPSAWRNNRADRSCSVCHYPTGSEDRLCSQACRNTAARGRRLMAAPRVGGDTHLRHVSGCGSMGGSGTGGAMKRRFNADNQKLQLN